MVVVVKLHNMIAVSLAVLATPVVGRMDLWGPKPGEEWPALGKKTTTPAWGGSDAEKSNWLGGAQLPTKPVQEQKTNNMPTKTNLEVEKKIDEQTFRVHHQESNLFC